MKRILIQNGRIITPHLDVIGNLLIENGKIISVGQEVSERENTTTVIDAGGRYVLPGFVDPHVHMELPTPAGLSSDDFESGSRAALTGGTTTLLDFVTPGRRESLIGALKKRKEAAAASLIDYSLHVSPVQWNNNTGPEIRECVRNEGITSFKAYLAYQNSIGIDDATLAAVMEAVAENEGLLMLHCENDGMVRYLQQKYLEAGKIQPRYHALSRPPEAEAEAISRAILFSRQFKCPLYIVHVSTGEGASLIEAARNEGLPVFGETCAQYLLLDQSAYDKPFGQAAACVMSPPLREKCHHEKLWDALAKGLLQTTGSDHCPFDKNQKAAGKNDFTHIPNGAGGVEFRPALLFTYGVLQNKISLQQWVSLISTNTARLFGLEQKGNLAPGMDADVVIWDPEAKSVVSSKTHMQHCDQNIYEGFEIYGKAETVITAGNIRIKAGEIVDDRTTGHFIRCRKPELF